ncbi:MAG TPA: MFS transporter [Candidatus Kapabacteria bacterium]|nr:MFS transporter [Candidatus Kapabacteria bacterium]
MSSSIQTLFRNKNFRLLFFGNALSGVGQGMTVIGTPWYIVRNFGSSHTLGIIMTTTIVSTLFVSPYMGALIDRHKRKNLILIENVLGFVGLGAMSLLGIFGGYSLITLGAVYWFTIMIFNLHFPATYALSQESFPPESYAHISGILEVVTQTAAIVAGGLTGVIIEHIGMPLIYAIDSITYAVAFFFLLAFTYEARVGVGISAAPKQFMKEMRTALEYLRSRSSFMWLNIALYIPFIVLVSIDLIIPFYISDVLHANATTYSAADMFYAAGATAAGWWMRNFSLSFGENFAYVSAFIMFIIALLTIALFPIVGIVFASVALTGWANAGIRVNRVAFIMHTVPTELIGRINSFFGWIGTCMRILILVFLTWAIDAIGSQWCYGFLALILVLSLGMYLQTSRKELAVRVNN